MSRLLACGALLLVAAFAGRAHAEEPLGQAGKKHGVKASEALDLVERHAVMVHVRFQKDLEAEEHGAVPPNPNGTSEVYRLWRMSYVVPGFVVKDRRTVLCSDLWVSQGAVASVTVRTLSGTDVKARVRGFLRRAEGVVLETESDLPVEPLVFPPEDPKEPREAALAASVAEGARGIESWVDGLGTLRRRVGSKKLAFGSVDAPTQGLSPDAGTRTIDLVLATGSIPIGFRFGGGMDVDDGIWRGSDVLGDTEIPLANLKERALSLQKCATCARVEVVFRTTKRDDREDQPYRRNDGAEGRTELWGFAVAPDLLIVPGRLEADAVRRIESVRWKVDAVTGQPAQYAGKVRGYDAFLVRVPGAKLDPLADTKGKVPAIGEAMLVHRTTWRGGERRDQVDYNRVLGWGRRYGDKLHLAVEREVDEGALLMDADGRVLGFSARLDPEDKEERLDEPTSFRRGRREFPLVAVLFDDVGPATALVNDPDTRVMPQEETESKRLPWLGVETTGFTKLVAEMLEISAPTRDGARGLLVGRVYADSPAARAGIEAGDILLTAKRTSGPGADAPPMDLEESGGGGGWFHWGSFMGFGDDEAPQPWKSQDTALHRLLKTWGNATTFDVQYLRKKELKTASLTVEFGPPTYDSAPRQKDDGTGVTVRDMTYEVRASLRLPKGAPGVVVSRTEPGSPAAQARMAKNEIIEEVEGAPVKDAADFVGLLQAARAGGKDMVRLVVRRLDKTRLVDLGLAPKDLPADAEKPADADAPPANGDEKPPGR